MSAAPVSGSASKAAAPEKTAASSKDVKPAAALEEDDEFEDFPVESTFPLVRLSMQESGAKALYPGCEANGYIDWTQEDTEVPGDNTHLWEESWDDDDTSEDFSAQLK
jgi:26 proteasome complex subunit DSS1